MSPGFEQQLVRALRRGCPICNSDEFIVVFIDVSNATVTERNGELRWGQRQRLTERRDEMAETEALCRQCSRTLWTPRDGWIRDWADLEAV